MKTKNKSKCDFDVGSEVDVESESSITTDIPPLEDGRILRLRGFGGFDQRVGDNVDGVIYLYWVTSTSEELVMCGGGGWFNCTINRDFIGNGTDHFRIVKQNFSKQTKKMFAWVDNIILT